MSKMHHKSNIRVTIADLEPEDEKLEELIIELVQKTAVVMKEEIDKHYWSTHLCNPAPSIAGVGDYYENPDRWVRRVIVNIDYETDKACTLEFTRNCSKNDNPNDWTAWRQTTQNASPYVRLSSLVQWSRTHGR